MIQYAQFDAPGKVFLFGEYAVLDGAPAWLAAVGPRFRLEARASRGERPRGTMPFRPPSPAGKLWREAVSQMPSLAERVWAWHDPHERRGGFGASSAQFVLLYRALAPVLGWPDEPRAALARYHALHEAAALPPSGADVATQWAGGIVRYTRSAGAEARRLDWDFSRVLLFSATFVPGRKVETHGHLARLGATFRKVHGESLNKMRALLTRADEAPALDTDTFAGIAAQYAGILADAGLEAQAAAEDRHQLQRLPGVLAVKGTGAGLSDALWIVLERGVSTADRDAVIAAARARGLRPMPLPGGEEGACLRG